MQLEIEQDKNIPDRQRVLERVAAFCGQPRFLDSQMLRVFRLHLSWLSIDRRRNDHRTSTAIGENFQ
jgi:hypothetical protein